MTLPHPKTVDSTRAFFRQGYRYVGDTCATLGTDAFATRLTLRPVVCMMGEEAARRFYDGAHFTRVGAMPGTTLRLLQDKGSVQSLDGAAHRARKAMFLSMLTGDEVAHVGRLFDARFAAAWRRTQRAARRSCCTTWWPRSCAMPRAPGRAYRSPARRSPRAPAR